MPCKDRQYDPDKHCGVKTDSMDKECTRSLTCKTHSLTLRRQVNGRAKSFDDLLEEHRKSKEEALRLAGKEVKLTKKQLKQKEQEAKKALLAQVKSEKDAAAAAVKAPSTCSTSSFIASPSPIGSTCSDTGDFSPKVSGKSKQGSSSLLLQTALSASPASVSSPSATKLSLQSNLNARIQKKREIELQQDSSSTSSGVKFNGTHLDPNTISPKPVINSNINLNVAHGTNSPLFSPSSNVSIASLGLCKSNNSSTSQAKTTANHSNRLAAPLIVKSSHLPSPSTAPVAVEGANNIIYLKHPPRPLAVNSFNCRHLILSDSSSSVTSSSSSSNLSSSNVHNNNNNNNINNNNNNSNTSNTSSLSNGQRHQVNGSPPPPIHYEASFITSPIFGRTNDQMYAALRTVFQLDPKSTNLNCGVNSNSSIANGLLGNNNNSSNLNNIINNSNNNNNSNCNSNNASISNSPGILSARTSRNSTTPPSPFTSVPLSKLNTNTTPVTLINALTGATATKVTLSPLTSNAKRGKGNLQNQPAFTPICQLTKQDSFVQPQSIGQPVFNQIQSPQQSVTNSQPSPQPSSSSILINSAPNLSQALFNRTTNQPVKRKLTPLNQVPSFVTASINNNSNNSNNNGTSNNNNNNSNSSLGPSGSTSNTNNNTGGNQSASPKITRSLIGLNAPSLISLLESGISNNNSSSNNSNNNGNNSGGLLLSNSSFLPNVNNVAGITGINNASNVAGLAFGSSSSQSHSQGNGLLSASLVSPSKKVKANNSPASGVGGNASTGYTSALSTPTLESLLDAGIPGSNRPTSADPLTATAPTGLPSLLISSRELN